MGFGSALPSAQSSGSQECTRGPPQGQRTPSPCEYVEPQEVKALGMGTWGGGGCWSLRSLLHSKKSAYVNPRWAGAE